MSERLEENNQEPTYFPTEGLTLEQDRQLVQLLKLWSGGSISTPVFTELARMTPQAIVELVIFRMNNGVLETLIIPRPEDDVVWPGKFHTPGTALRLADFNREDRNPLNGAFERIKRSEVNIEFEEPVFVRRLHVLTERRGAEVSEIYITEPKEGFELAPNHQWYPVEQLGSNPDFISHQLPFIRIAAEHYLQSKTSN